MPFSELEIWFATGSEDARDTETLEIVREQSSRIVRGLQASPGMPIRIVATPTLTTLASIRKMCSDANRDDACIGVVVWMHTFSPPEMWTAGIEALTKPLLHLHTQHNRHLPWADIDLGYADINQSPTADRAFANMLSRIGKPNKVVAGTWQSRSVQERISNWARAAAGAREIRSLRVARFSPNLRGAEDIELDKVEMQSTLGVAVESHGADELADRVSVVPDVEVDRLCGEYEAS